MSASNNPTGAVLGTATIASLYGLTVKDWQSAAAIALGILGLGLLLAFLAKRRKKQQ